MSGNYNSNWLSYDLYQYAGTDLVTYTSEDGFRPLTASEYDNTFTAAASTGTNSNVWLTGPNTLNNNQTINALKMGHNVTQTINAKLTVTSGVLLGNHYNNAPISIAGTGTISSGTRAFIVYGSQNTITFGPELTLTNDLEADDPAPGLILAQAGTTTILSGSNSYGGSTLVQGKALVNNSHAITNSELRVDLGGALSVGNNSHVEITKLSGNGTVNFSDTPPGNQLNIGGTTGTADTVTVNNGGIVAPGDLSGKLQTGTLFLGDYVEALTFKAGAFLDLDIADDLTSDMIVSLNNLSTLTFENNATIRLNFLSADYTPDFDTASWQIVSGFESVVGNLDNLNVTDTRGYDYHFILEGNNLLLHAQIPEPSTWLLLTIGATLLVTTLRRRR
jgi:hypothetical protein